MKNSALIAAVVLIGFGAATASAQASTKACPKNALCLWAKENYTGLKTVIKESGASNVGKKMNNKTSSVKSRYTDSEDERTYLFDKRGAKGDYFCLGGGLETKLPQLGPPYLFDNKTTSVLLPKSDEGPVCN